MQDLISSGSLVLACLVAILAGAVSFFSPCVLPLVPGYLAYVGGSATAASAAVTGDAAKRGRRRLDPRLILGSLLFVAGFTVVFVLFFALAGTVGSWLLVHERIITQVMGVVIIVLGLAFIGVLKPLQQTAKVQAKPAAGLLGAPVLGAAFALGWTPCIGPTLGVIFALSLQEATAARGALLGVAYCIGLGLPFVLAAAGLGWMANVSRWVIRHMRQVNLAGGILLLLIGLLMVTGLWSKLMFAMQAWIGTVTLPL